nr:hypothetical protein [Ktedonobacterales bacterium]
MPKHRKHAPETDVAQMQYDIGLGEVRYHPLFAPLAARAWILPDREHRYCPSNGRAVVDSHGTIYCNTLQRIAPAEWSFAIAHCLLHLGFGHFETARHDLAWNLACDCTVNSFLLSIKFGQPGRLGLPAEFEGQSEERIYRRLTEDGIPTLLEDCGMAGPHGRDMVFLAPEEADPHQITWQATLAAGLQN